MAATTTDLPEAPPLSFAEHTCLALVDEGPRHGWALVRDLAPDGEVGRLWHLSRALTYRALDGLAAKGMVAREEPRPRRTRDRVLLRATPLGREANRAWLDAPVEHLRDVRTELLVKLQLRRRAGLDVEGLLRAQRELFGPRIDRLLHPVEGELADLWRRESARAVRRFLDVALGDVPVAPTRRTALRLSARNQLAATVARVRHAEVMSTVEVTLGDGQPLTAAITRDSAEDLALTPGDHVTVVITSTDVMLAKEG